MVEFRQEKKVFGVDEDQEKDLIYCYGMVFIELCSQCYNKAQLVPSFRVLHMHSSRKYK